MFFENKILLKDLNSLLINFLILDQLELLNLIDEATLFGDNNHRILPLLVEKGFLAAFKDKIAAFKRHDQGSWIFRLHYRADCLEDALFNESLNLLGRGLRR